jgi:hypothetical protein
MVNSFLMEMVINLFREALNRFLKEKDSFEEENKFRFITLYLCFILIIWKRLINNLEDFKNTIAISSIDKYENELEMIKGSITWFLLWLLSKIE